MSQQIYTKDEIGNKGMITSIAFYNYDTGSARVCDIYLTHTAKESFDSSTDRVTVSAEDKVYSGKMELKSNWTVIEFDTPFQYDGEQNLLLTVDDNTGEDTGFNYSVGASDASGNQSLSKADVEIASSVATVKTVKSSGVHYNLSGQRVGKAYKGIVIVDGAKTIRK